MGHGLFDGAAQPVQVVGQVRGNQRGAGGDHAAADIHADRRRNNRTQGRNHTADGRAFAQVHIRHHCQVFEDERHLRRVDQLLTGFVFQRHALGPEFDRFAAGHFKQVHVTPLD
ncbi:hypothetical protein D9M73_179560 [compost metagenome]